MCTVLYRASPLDLQGNIFLGEGRLVTKLRLNHRVKPSLGGASESSYRRTCQPCVLQSIGSSAIVINRTVSGSRVHGFTRSLAWSRGDAHTRTRARERMLWVAGQFVPRPEQPVYDGRLRRYRGFENLAAAFAAWM